MGDQNDIPIFCVCVVILLLGSLAVMLAAGTGPH